MSSRVTYALAVVLFLLAASVVRLFDVETLSRLRLLAFDTLQQISPRKPDPRYPVRIIDIDDDSIAEIGQWPWRRSILAKLVERLDDLGAEIIAFDFVFPLAERSLVDEIPEEMRQEPDVKSVLGRISTISGDKKFAQAINGKQVVLGVIGRAGLPAKDVKSKSGFAFLGSAPQDFVPGFESATLNVDILQQSAAGLGALNWFPEHDQIIRRVPLLVVMGDEIFPSLSAEVLRIRAGDPSISVKASTASGQTGFGVETGIASVRTGGIEVPTDSSGQVWLAFTEHAPERFRSARDILNGNVPRSDIEGRIVLIGTSAPGLFDLRATPLDAALAGVEVHAQALEQMLSGRVLLRPDYSTGMEIVITLILSIFMADLVRRSGAFVGAMAGGLSTFSVLGAIWWLYQSHGLLLDPVFPAITMTAVYVFGTAFYYLQTERERNRVRQAFSHYMAPSLVERLIREPERLKLGGETRELTVLFSDVRGFTRIAEGYRERPDELIQLMNRLLTPLSDAIVENNGTIDKYIGDAVMAFWNAPLDDDDHPRHACLAALQMIQDVAALNYQREQAARQSGVDYAPLRLGIGIATGPSMVGNMGSEMRFDYSALGDTVNLSSRLEGLTGHYGAAILLADETCRRGASGLAVVEIDRVSVRGRGKAENIWALVGGEEVLARQSFQAFEAAFAEAMTLYRRQDWNAARDAFSDLSESAGEFNLDGIVETFRERISSLMREPPHPDWDAIWRMTEK